MFRLDREKKVVVYGAGEKGRQVCRFMQDIGIEVLYIMDRNESLWGTVVPCGGERCAAIWGLDKGTESDKEGIVVICTMENAFQHEKVAEALYGRGYQNIIFLPILHMDSEKSTLLYEVYNRILDRGFDAGTCPALPSYAELNAEMEKKGFYGHVFDIKKNRAVVYLPMELLFSETPQSEDLEAGQKGCLLKFAHTNVMARSDYLELWSYLETGSGECLPYIQTHFPEETWGDPGIRHMVLEGRGRLLGLYDKEFRTYEDKFFLRSPASGYLSTNGQVCIKDGLHRITYRIIRDQWEAPVELREEDYMALGGTEKDVQLLTEKQPATSDDTGGGVFCGASGVLLA